MGNTLRLAISNIGLSCTNCSDKMGAKRKTFSILILGIQESGKSTIALRLWKYKKTLPDLQYVASRGFNTFQIKKGKIQIHLNDIGGNPAIRELWEHYYSDAHGIIYVVDSTNSETVAESQDVLTQVLNDERVKRKPILLLANKMDVSYMSDVQLEAALNLRQLVNEARCLTRCDHVCAVDLKLGRGIFEGFKWLTTYIESHFDDLNERVINDTMTEMEKEKLRRQKEKDRVVNSESPSTVVAEASTNEEEPIENTQTDNKLPLTEVVAPMPRMRVNRSSAQPDFRTGHIENRIEIHRDPVPEVNRPPTVQPRSTSGKSITRHSPEGADSDEGIVNHAFEMSEGVGSATTSSSIISPIKLRGQLIKLKGDIERPGEILMVTTLAQVHDFQNFKDRRASTSTHESVTMSVASLRSEETDVWDEGLKSKPSSGKDKPGKKRFNFKMRSNKTQPLPVGISVSTIDNAFNQSPLSSRDHQMSSRNHSTGSATSRQRVKSAQNL